jgi:hypothetical protein
VRATDREKSYHQTTWTLAGKSIPASAYETINVDGYPAFFGLKDWDSTIASAYGANAFNPNGQKQEDWQIQNDKLAGWKVKERSTSAFVQGDLDGEAFGKPIAATSACAWCTPSRPATVRSRSTARRLPRRKAAPRTPKSCLA